METNLTKCRAGMDKMDVAKRIAELMAYYGLDRGAFASLVGMEPSNVSHLTSGRNKLSFEKLGQVLAAFPNLNARWLVLGEPPIELPQPPSPPGGLQLGAAAQNTPAGLFPPKDEQFIPPAASYPEQDRSGGGDALCESPIPPAMPAHAEPENSPSVEPPQPDLLVLREDGTYMRYTHRKSAG